MNQEELRNGIYSLRTRRFGTVAEIMIKKLEKLDWGDNISHDLIDKRLNKRIEVKFSTAMRSNKNKITESNVLEEIYQALDKNRMFKRCEWSIYSFDCNIQQVKKKEFDILYYGIFFSDLVEIFKIQSNEIDEAINYSDKQHAGNVGEGQFHLNNKTYEYHRQNFFQQSLSYEELYKLLK